MIGGGGSSSRAAWSAVQPSRNFSTSAIAAAGSTSPTSVRIDPLGTSDARCSARTSSAADGGDGGFRRHLPRDRVVAEPLALQRLPRDRARLGAGHRDPFDEPVALAGDLPSGWVAAVSTSASTLSTSGRPAASPEPDTSSRSGSTHHAEVGADGGQLVVDRHAVAGRGAGEQGLGRAARRTAGVLGRAPGERDAQAQLDHGDARAVRGEHPQAVGERCVGHVRQRDVAGGPSAGSGRGPAVVRPISSAVLVTQPPAILTAGDHSTARHAATAAAQRGGGGPHLLGGDGGQAVRQLGRDLRASVEQLAGAEAEHAVHHAVVLLVEAPPTSARPGASAPRRWGLRGELVQLLVERRSAPGPGRRPRGARP